MTTDPPECDPLRGIFALLIAGEGLDHPLQIYINVLVICFGITYTILINRK